MSTPAEFVRRLARLDVCAVSDAMDKLGLPPAVSGIEQRSTTRRIAGRVVTYRLVAAAQAPRQEGAPRHLGTTAIEMAQPGEVIVTVGADPVCNGAGGVHTIAAGIVGKVSEPPAVPEFAITEPKPSFILK